MAEIDEVLAEIDRAATREFKVRTIVLERAEAASGRRRAAAILR